jgi:exosortase A
MRAVAVRPLGRSLDLRAPWPRHLVALGAAAAIVALLFAQDAADMVSIWWNASTYNHALLIPPLIVWLAWQRAPQLRQLIPQPWLPGLAIVLVGSLAWLLGYGASVATGRHLGLVLMLQGAVVALLGPAVARGLLFPLGFALFMVPVGDELVPFLQTLTAELAMALLNLSGVPAHIEGVFITTRAGYFEVAEACAGAKFLIAMIALGALVANLCFRSWRRRAAFIAACVIVPLIANGVRAFATIYVAEGSGIQSAAGFDHVVYGGIFFALVMAAILGAAWPFFDRKVGDPWFVAERLQPVPPQPALPARLWRAAAVACAIAAAPLLWAGAVAASGRQQVATTLEPPQVPGWALAPPSGRPWSPHFAGADAQRQWTYRNPAGQEVTLAIALFARQEEGRELVGFGQGAVAPESGWAWTADAPAPPNGRAERIVSRGELREVVSFYRVGDSLTGSAMGVKLETLRVRLLGGPQRAVSVLVSAPAPATGESPRPALDAFLAALGPVEALADRAAGGD